MKKIISQYIFYYSAMFVAGVFVFSSLSLIHSQSNCGSNISFFKSLINYAYANPYASDQRGSCQIEYETYELSGSYVQVPLHGNSEQSQDFEGYDVYEYFYPANPEKNDDKRKKLYSFNGNGSVEMGGNIVVRGERTSLYNEFDNGNIGIASYDEDGSGERSNVTHSIQTSPRSNDVTLSGNARINGTWQSEETTGGLGPSVFFDLNSSRLEMQDNHYLAGARKDAIIETSLKSSQSEYVWIEHLSDPTVKVKQLSNARAMAFKDPAVYISDMGNRAIVGYDLNTETYISLGKRDWNWSIEGVAIDDDRYLYLSDTAMNTIVKTKITGEGWEESYKDLDDYQSRLFLDGSEEFIARCMIESYAREAEISDCGYNKHDVSISSSRNYIDIDPETKRPLMSTSTDCVFGEACFSFNGREHIQMSDNAAWNFEEDFFTFDLWVRFDSLERTMALVSHPGSYLFEWKPESGNMSQSVLSFTFINSDRNESDDSFTSQSFQENWLPEVGEWYNLAIVRREDNTLTMMVDGEQLGPSVPITGSLRNGVGEFEIGGYINGKELDGAMDNIRVARGDTQWEVDYSFRYQFDDPMGLIVVKEGGKDYLYVADSGNSRIVKISTDFTEWWTFGEKGSDIYQFDHPTDIYYYAGYFYITDAGNSRVIKTNLAQMQKYFKGEVSGSWEVIYSSDSPDLHSIYVDADGYAITDAYNGMIITSNGVVGSKNAWDKLFEFTAPVDIARRDNGNYLILDGTSNTDFTTHVEQRTMDSYGTAQREGLNTRFYSGGVMVYRAYFETAVAMLKGDEWRRWIADDIHLGISHCPEIPNSTANFGGCNGGLFTGEGANVSCSIPSECVGQWDWEVYWPTCVHYVPTMKRVSVCTGTNGDGSCASYENDCYTYCEPVEEECHVGFAVWHEFVESGPPEYAPTRPDVPLESAPNPVGSHLFLPDPSFSFSGSFSNDFWTAVEGLNPSRENIPTVVNRLNGMGYDASIYEEPSTYCPNGGCVYDKIFVNGQRYDILVVESVVPKWNSPFPR